MNNEIKWLMIGFAAMTFAASIAISVQEYSNHLTNKAAMENGYVEEMDGFHRLWKKID